MREPGSSTCKASTVPSVLSPQAPQVLITMELKAFPENPWLSLGENEGGRRPAVGGHKGQGELGAQQDRSDMFLRKLPWPEETI